MEDAEIVEQYGRQALLLIQGYAALDQRKSIDALEMEHELEEHGLHIELGQEPYTLDIYDETGKLVRTI